MELTAVVAFLTAAVSVGVKVVGLPDQIKSNYKRKSTAGLSTWFVVSAFVSYLLWTIHGIQVHDNTLIIGQGLGVLTSGIIVWQVLIYRTEKRIGSRLASTISGFSPYKLQHKLRGRAITNVESEK